ncbi:hypothetical protein R1flu_016706 [Riccia fluitans]|uniref:Retrotransposon gag domain-containing protein n=1 Tax=Riccia fluitans TaxID=41844 RepID=A0ABD1YNF5_9MARC
MPSGTLSLEGFRSIFRRREGLCHRQKQAKHSSLGSYIGHIQDCDSPKKAWDALANLFQSGTEARKLQLLQQFNSVKKGSMCINNFVNQIKSLADQLASVKIVVDPTVLIGTTLQGLPSEY